MRNSITTDDVIYRSDFRNELSSVETDSDIPVGKLFDGDRGALKSWLISYVLRDARNYVRNNVASVETDTTAVAQGEHYRELKNNLRRHKEEIIWGPGGKQRYRNAPDKTAATLRYIYYQNILKWIDNVEDKQEQAKTKIDGDIAGNVPGISGGDQPLGEHRGRRRADTHRQRTPIGTLAPGETAAGWDYVEMPQESTSVTVAPRFPESGAQELVCDSNLEIGHPEKGE